MDALQEFIDQRALLALDRLESYINNGWRENATTRLIDETLSEVKIKFILEEIER